MTLEVILLSFKNRKLKCVLLAYTLESSTCSTLIKVGVEDYCHFSFGCLKTLSFWEIQYVQLKISKVNFFSLFEKRYILEPISFMAEEKNEKEMIDQEEKKITSFPYSELH